MKKLENKYLKLANECADISGRIISKYFRKKIKIEVKSDNTPVTKADKESEKKIRDLITKKAPECGFFGEEESGDVNLSADLSGKKTIKKNGKAIKGFTDLEKRLKYYKKLRDAKKISEREYQKKKTELLNRL